MKMYNLQCAIMKKVGYADLFHFSFPLPEREVARQLRDGGDNPQTCDFGFVAIDKYPIGVYNMTTA